MSKYAEQWQDYRRRRNLLLFAYIGFLPVAIVFILVTLLLFGDKPHTDTPGGVFGFCWLAFSFFASLRVSRFRCPRCGNMFFYQVEQRLVFRIWRGNVFSGKCLHCGLPKYSGEETHAP
jgi:hypothetical protein